MKDFVNDLVRLADKQRSKLSFTVDLKAMICDAPQRAECKGVKLQTGYYCCERCKVKGNKIGNGNMHFPSFDDEARTDENWWDYYTPETKVRMTYFYNNRVAIYILTTIIIALNEINYLK